ncbi:BBP7 family outer membrane beta-barrel protein [Thalassoglobus sp. JC818]|uniref:BBP7 family outer membrane beta-barrel protein n=1 Tax=Thalassoglobus sp. JC818 TaxID=3232136 RepID=UPI003457A12B
MTAQAKLVRCVERGRELISAAISRCDQQLRFGIKSLAVGVLASACTCSAADLMAQDWPPPASAMPPGGYAQPVGFHQHVDDGAYCPPEYAALEAELFPKERPMHDIVMPFDQALHSVFQDSWMRLEYMYGRVYKNGGRVLGSRTTDINGNTLNNVTDQFPLLFADGITTGDAIVPDTDSIEWKHMNGIRGSFGIPLDDRSWFEASFWGIEEQSDALRVPRIPPTSLNNVFGKPPIQFIATTFTTDGEVGTAIAVYDQDFSSNYRVNLWSAEANYVEDLRIPFDGWKLQSIIGYRHEEYSEQLNFGGTFTNISGYLDDGVDIDGPLANPQTNNIDSKVHNFRHALQFGIRSEITQNWLTVGVEPRVAFGIAQVRRRVKAVNVVQPGTLFDASPDPVYTSDRIIQFAPSADLNLYAKIDVNRWLKFKVGYNLIWLGRLGTADSSFTLNQISSDDPTLPPTADVRVKQGFGNAMISALTLGGEIILP